MRHYAEGIGLRATERLVGVSHNSVMNWLRQQVAGQSLVPADASQVQTIEADELWSYVGEKHRVWLWWAIDRATGQVLAWTLGGRDTRAAPALGAQIPQGQHIRYCTDHWQCYGAIFPQAQHTQSKAQTHIIESMNNRLRCYLARLRRKTHCYSKSVNNLRDSLLFIFRRKLNYPLKLMDGWAVNHRLLNSPISISI